MIRCLSRQTFDAEHLRNLATNSLNRVSSGDKAGGDDLFHEPRRSAEKRRVLQPLPGPPYETTTPVKRGTTRDTSPITHRYALTITPISARLHRSDKPT